MSSRIDPNDRFDQELRRAVRELVTEELPRGVLDPMLGVSLGLRGADGAVRARRALPGFAAIGAALLVLFVATAITLAPGSPFGSRPSPSPSPPAVPSPVVGSAFRTTAQIRADMLTLGYSCVAGRPLSTTGPGPNTVAREAIVCTTPDTPVFMAAVIVGESTDRTVVEVHAKADFVDGDTTGGRSAVAAMLAKAAAIGVVEGTGNLVGTWVSENAPALEPNESRATDILGLVVKLARTSDGGYVLFVDLAGIS